MIYNIEVVKEVVHRAQIEGNTLREALQAIVDDDRHAVDWQWDGNLDLDEVEPTAVIDVSVDGNTPKQDRELLKEAKKIWKEIS